MSEEWKTMTDWSDLPDVYVTKAECQQGMFWRVETCSVPMAIGPEVRLIRADVVAAMTKAHEKEIAVWAENYAALERQLAEARTDAEQAVAVAYQKAADKAKDTLQVMPTCSIGSAQVKVSAAILALAPSDALAEVKNLIKMRDDCNIYLKDGETPRQRMDRDHADVLALMEMLTKDRSRRDAAEAEVEELKTQLQTVLDREAAAYARFDKKIEELEETIEDYRSELYWMKNR